MLPIGKTRRKLRPLLHAIIFSFGLFLFIVGFGICSVFLTIIHPTIISPLGKALLSLHQSNSIEVQTMEGLAKDHIQYSKITVGSDTVTILLQNDTQIVLTTKKSIASQIASLQLTLTDLTIDKRKPIKIDFRFDRPVVTF